MDACRHPDHLRHDDGEYTGDNSKSPANPKRSITPEQFQNRMILRQAMLRHGFKPFDTEWWHFTLKDVQPKIKRLSFPKRGKFQVDLQDGRSVLMPVSAFPSLKKVPVKERNNWYLMGGGVTWDSCPEVIHIEQILGNYQNYAHESA
ncbi:MAG: DUF2442 domain-containing protein [Prevotella sp.]|nr:DUF2442 domain-containing protein [Prevotella sp.]